MMIRLLLSLVLAAFAVHGALVRTEITSRRDVLDGQPFGESGAYELLRGRAYFAVDPASTRVTDIQFAPRNASGHVEFSADILILRPKDPKKGNQTLLLETPNRGAIGMLAMYNRAKSSLDPESAEHFGDGYLLREGYTLVWLGWQHDVPHRPGLLRAHVPSAQNVSGLVRGELTPSGVTQRIPLGDNGHIPYPASKIDSLTVRDGIHGKRSPIPASEWRLEGNEIVLSNPATPGLIYEFIYKSTQSAVAGLGLSALRDFVSDLKYGPDARVRFALGVGTSQSAMALRALVYEGFNADEKGRKVFDGLQPHVAGGRRATFERFTQPSRTSGPFRNASFSTTDQFPFSDADDIEPATGRKDSILRRALSANAVPKIIYTNSSYEYFGSAGSLVHTSLDGKRDLALPATTRVYLLSGGQHGPAAFPPRPVQGENLPNWNDYKWVLRAMLRNLHQWVANGTEPPPSQYPKIADRTLSKDPKTHRTQSLDFGPQYLAQGIITIQPPKPGPDYNVLVPQPDSDGNDVAGVKMPWVSVPLGAFTGWNLRAAAIGAPGQLLANTGSFIPFSEERIQRIYPTAAEYKNKIETAARGLVSSRFLLEQDVPQILRFGERVWAWSQQRKSEQFERSTGASPGIQ